MNYKSIKDHEIKNKQVINKLALIPLKKHKNKFTAQILTLKPNTNINLEI
ncbi:hypothetical protein XBI1_1870032 [Xenorhabdus bovienii str. Intermedium]|uniref:Uncharacterized protein n=1 Tax=Xenorhabdus bovienii str. Intermedium TaxID=1379677 RepID=A0A077QI80_XENBV|nr:hypothetical protein XBI1_1870032 [Xenorhabdus bovienii str. Intermedium]